MRKKIVIFISAAVFSIIALTNFNLSSKNQNVKVSISDVAMMASADEECSGGCDCYCPNSGAGCLYRLDPSDPWTTCPDAHS